MNNFSTLAISTILSGCLTTGNYEPPAMPQSPTFSRVVAADFENTWRAIIDHVSSTFFVIENFEKDSGLVTVSFGSAEPHRFVDCGYARVQWFDEQYVAHKFDGHYVTFLTTVQNGSLSGRMNISARPTSEGETEVRVNARYIISAPPEIWSFDSGSSATVTVRNAVQGMGDTRTCVPTYVAERDILTAVAASAE